MNQGDHMTEKSLEHRLKGEELSYKIKKIDRELRTLLYKIHDVVIRQKNENVDLSVELDSFLLEKEVKTNELKESYREWYRWEQS